MYEIEGVEFSLEDLQAAAEEHGMDIDSYISKLEKKD